MASIEDLSARSHGRGSGISGRPASDVVFSTRGEKPRHAIVQEDEASRSVSSGTWKRPCSRRQYAEPSSRGISQRRPRQPISSSRATIRPQIRRFSGAVGVPPSTVYLWNEARLFRVRSIRNRFFAWANTSNRRHLSNRSAGLVERRAARHIGSYRAVRTPSPIDSTAFGPALRHTASSRSRLYADGTFACRTASTATEWVGLGFGPDRSSWSATRPARVALAKSRMEKSPQTAIALQLRLPATGARSTRADPAPASAEPALTLGVRKDTGIAHRQTPDAPTGRGKDGAGNRRGNGSEG